MGRDLASRVEGNAVATRDSGQQQPVSIGQLIQQLRPEMSRALPKHMDADRMARIALTVLRTNPSLGLSTKESFMGALLTCAQLGLEPGAGGEAYLVPYAHRRGPLAGKTECQLIIGYQGLVKLFWQHPLAKHIDAQAVHEHDEFDYAYGLDPFLRHKPALGDRGRVVAYYGVATLTTGGSAFVVLSPDQVKALRQGKVGPSGQIADPMAWMERKTVLRQLLKTLPKSANLLRAEVVDEKIRTDLAEDAIDLPGAHREIEAGGQVVQSEAGPVDTSTGEIQDDQPPAERPKGDITQAQQRKLHAALRDAVGDDRAAGLRLIGETLERDVQSTAELSKAEAGRVIDELEKIVASRSQAAEPESTVDQAEVDKAWGVQGGEPA
jgi:recombination protein RecT